jgi:hypothetical protein
MPKPKARLISSKREHCEISSVKLGRLVETLWGIIAVHSRKRDHRPRQARDPFHPVWECHFPSNGTIDRLSSHIKLKQGQFARPRRAYSSSSRDFELSRVGPVTSESIVLYAAHSQDTQGYSTRVVFTRDFTCCGLRGYACHDSGNVFRRLVRNVHGAT